MRPNFEFYMASLDRWPFHVGVDLGLIEKAPLEGLTYRAHVRLELNHPNLDGLCSKEEEALLFAIEEDIVARLPKDSCFVAQVTHRNARTLVIYLKDKPEGEHVIFDILRAIETHRTKVMFEEDPEWSEYRDFLYPNQNFRHQIRDRHVLKEFERRGDDCSQVHSIEPVFAGLDAERAKQLAADLRAAGFQVKELGEVGSNGTRSWRVIGKVESPLALSILDDFRQVWLELAERAGAHYDGWSAEVIPVSNSR